MPLYFQARWAERIDYDAGIAYRSREFSPSESWETAGTISAACVAGTASVVTGVACTAVGMAPLGVALATPLMMAANLGGARYATMNSDARLFETRVWVPWFEHKEYSVRMFEGGQHVLWDVKDNRQLRSLVSYCGPTLERVISWRTRADLEWNNDTSILFTVAFFITISTTVTAV
ncbi:hypothetical protein PAXRUDRAFT_24707 [Paxillus rubicundulus Ve08.2h10]|uniref:Unplaced genomic scaffold scaffold_121, whole genome shotgun sequence n=1 Tax=Paxillus rubicundulus Ve08.2h10 TaxID=930991 RepID=A0A0D0EBA5_9AGAM|nr:hypothetical protein PAXRUDRAFT_24707 [Paxillus rubicundulus Ve08.2h10]